MSKRQDRFSHLKPDRERPKPACTPTRNTLGGIDPHTITLDLQQPRLCHDALARSSSLGTKALQLAPLQFSPSKLCELLIPPQMPEEGVGVGSVGHLVGLVRGVGCALLASRRDACTGWWW